MSARLPNAKKATLEISKLRDYCLNLDYPRGRHKGRVFRASLGVGAEEADELRDILLKAAATTSATRLRADDWGEHWRIDVAPSRDRNAASW
jgi:hypothetical protein